MTFAESTRKGMLATVADRMLGRHAAHCHDARVEDTGAVAFDELAYLAAHPDVASAVRNGAFVTGHAHYERFGRAEGRRLVPALTRDQKILVHVDREGMGLEIGPSHRPVAAKRHGFRVEILDHLDAAGLRAKYLAEGHDVAVDAIEEVDHVWRGEPLSELVGSHRFDWIIASHVIEHTPDLVGFLNECERMLKPDGVLSLAVPDQRYCFDHFRDSASLGRLVDAHLAGATRHSKGTAAEYFLNVTRKNDVIAWDDRTTGEYRLIHTLAEARSVIDRVDAGEYIDLHAWCFTPTGFRLAVEDLASLGFVRLREMAFFDTVGHEFFVTLGARGTGPDLERIELLARKRTELAQGA